MVLVAMLSSESVITSTLMHKQEGSIFPCIFLCLYAYVCMLVNCQCFHILLTDISKLVEENQQKSGIAFLCVHVGSPEGDEYIENCYTMEKMQDCFETKLGYLTISLGMIVTGNGMSSLLRQIEKLTLPKSFSRVIFYYFGHGSSSFLKLADGYFDRQHIISTIQSISAPESAVHKIFLFDTCRYKDVTCVAVQESEELMPLQVAWPPLIASGNYPSSTNTLIVDATEESHKAYYYVKNGCGLMTQSFVDLVLTQNQPLQNLLISIRCEILLGQLSMTNSPEWNQQFLVYDDRLMGDCNLLAESHGTG